MSDFVHFVRSDLSLEDSLVTVGGLVSAVADQGGKAVVLADHQNMFGMIRFYQKAAAKGVKPISASEVTVKDGDREGPLTLVCKNNTGYKNLMALISLAYEEGYETPKSDNPTVKKEWLEKYSEGMAVLSGARKGLVGQAIMAEDRDLAVAEATWLKDTYGEEDAYLEIQRTGLESDELHLQRACRLANFMKMPVIATNNVRFLKAEDYKAHEVRAAISKRMTVENMNRVDGDKYTPHMYLKSSVEMAELFDDIPAAVENTVELARRCSVDLEFGKNYLPAFPVPEGQTEADFLRDESWRGLNDRLEFLFGKEKALDPEIRKTYGDRLEYELNIINEMGFPGYFLIVADFIQWSKDNDIPVGPGRGSGAGSLVAYALKITDLDPINYSLLFERFLNPERVSMPDFDVDFCMDRRDEVIAYVAEKYGHKAVSQIVTFGTLAARMVVRDVARAKGHPYAVGDRISKLIPGTPGTTLTEALESELSFQAAYNNDPVVRDVVDTALKLEGLARQTGKHAGGVLIAPNKLTDHTPTYNAADGTGFVSQYDKNDVETAGLVKFDFLGLRTLTIVQNAVNAINKRKDRLADPLNILGIPLTDDKVFDIFKQGKTTAVFQVESRGMKELLQRMKPDNFEDIIALVALYRPGPLQSGMVDNFINRKHGREEISYPDPSYQHELLKPILEPTYGIILYQEQVMQIAQVLAGYTLGEADMLRRAMGKKKPEEMAKQRSIFQDGAKKNGIDPNLAIKIFDLVEKFAGYGFNKSHSAAYALISYQTAWLKEHYPAEFMASVLSSDMGNTDKVVSFIEECHDMKIKVLPPCVNHSDWHFKASESGDVLYGLGAIKGFGDSVIKKVLDDRAKNGPFKGFFNFIERINPNKRALEAAIKAGALDDFGFTRMEMIQNLDAAQKYARGTKKKTAKDEVMDDMFSDQSQEFEIDQLPGFKRMREMHSKALLSGERETIGHYMTSHPVAEAKDEVEPMITGRLRDLMDIQIDNNENMPGSQSRQVKVAGVIMGMDVRYNSRGHTAMIKLDDGSAQIDTMIYNKTFDECQYMLKHDTLLFIEGRLSTDRKTKRQKLVGVRVKNQQMVRDENFSHVEVELDRSVLTQEIKDQLKALIASQPVGLSQVKAKTVVAGQVRTIPLDSRSIAITDNLLYELKNLFGDESVKMIRREGAGTPAQNAQERKKLAEWEKQQLKIEGERTRKERHKAMAAIMAEARDMMSASAT